MENGKERKAFDNAKRKSMNGVLIKGILTLFTNPNSMSSMPTVLLEPLPLVAVKRTWMYS